MRPAVKAVIIEDGRLLCLAVARGDDAWYTLPGGGQEGGEALPDALRRECREELGCEIEVGELLHVRDYIAKNHEFAATEKEGFHQLELLFACRRAGGELGTGTLPDDHQQGVAWLPLADLPRLPLYPKILREVLVSGSPRVYLGDVN